MRPPTSTDPHRCDGLFRGAGSHCVDCAARARCHGWIRRDGQPLTAVTGFPKLSVEAAISSGQKQQDWTFVDIILFEDTDVEKLAPLTALRPTYTISCGGQTLLDAVRRRAARIAASVRPFLAEFQRCEFPELKAVDLAHKLQRPAWLLNARLIPRGDLLDVLERLREHAGNSRFMLGGAVAAAHVGAGTSPIELLGGDGSVRMPARQGTRHPLPEQLGLLEYPFDVIRHHEDTLAVNLALTIADGNHVELADGVYAHPSFTPPKFWATDTTDGPVIVQENACVGPFTLLEGPALVGPHARINEHSALKHGVTVGPYAKAGGEIECSILESYANKQHAGFLGHSYVGSWVNLGAGTTNSDLKNTYGTVQVVVGDKKLDTGMQFLGCVVGDYAKTAINSAIFSGKWLGACSMVYGTVTQHVPAFVNHLPAPGTSTAIDPKVIVSMQDRMFRRRGKAQQPFHVQLIHDLFARTCEQRLGLKTDVPQFP